MPQVRYVLIELSPLDAASAPEGLAAYHARIRALAAGVPAAQHEAVTAFLAAAADAAATAAAEFSADRRNQPGVSRASHLPAGSNQTSASSSSEHGRASSHRGRPDKRNGARPPAGHRLPAVRT
jgi:hypothetical protein